MNNVPFPAQINIRTVEPTDLVTLGVWAYFLSKHSWGWDYPIQPISEIRKADFIVGAFNGNEPVGFACVNRLASPDGIDNGQMWLSAWVVVPEWRKRGIGRTLFDKCLRYMESPAREERMLLSTENTEIMDFFLTKGWTLLRDNTLNESGAPTAIFELKRC